MTQFFGMHQGATTTYPVTVEGGGITLISHWKLDGNGIDAGGISNLTLTATTGGPPLLNDGGTSILVNGTSQFAQAANDGAYQNSDATIVFYAQPGSFPTSAQRTFVGKGTNSAGEVQIEQRAATDLNSSRMRAYSYDGTSVNYADNGVDTPSEGCVETPDDVAFMGALSLGPDGLKLYHWPAGGSIALVGSHPTTLGLTTNTEDWFIGRSPYTGGFFHGRFDNVQIYKGQLTLEQLALLPPPVTVVPDPEPPPPPPPPPGEGNVLTVPSLAEWLKSDVTTPPATKWVSNQNRGNGSGSSASNAQEVQAALNGASAGQTFIAACQTPGTIEYWNYPNGLSFPAGSSGNYITLQARQGDGVVISAGQDFAGARSSGFWTQSGLSQADIDKRIWRSVGTFSGGAQNMMGWWIEFGHPHQLLRASSMTNLRAAYGTADSPTNYSGPMVHKDTDGRVYIRFQRPHVNKYSAGGKWSKTAWPDNPEAVNGSGQFIYPISENPNNYMIHLCRVSSSIAGFRGASGAASWIKIGAGINSLGFNPVIRGSNTWMDRGTHLTHRFIMWSAAGDTRTNMFFNRARFAWGSVLHLCRAEWKFGGWLEGIRNAAFTMVNSETMNNIYWKDCTISDFHEIFTGAHRANRFRFRNCCFFNILDDGVQCHFNANRWEFGYCYFRGSAYGGMGVGGEAEGDATVPGEFFMHHNILDVRFEVGSDWRAQPHPRYPYLSHSPDGRSPWKIYNNLILFGPDQEEEFGTALMHCPTNTDNTLTGAKNMHEVFNNIVLRAFVEGTKRYDPTFTSTGSGSGYSNGSKNRSDYVNGGSAGSGHTFIRYSAAFSNELFDYNCYWRPSSMNFDPFFENYRRGRGQTAFNFSSLAAWKAHAEFAHSKLSGSFRGAYSPGFDGNSTETKPTLPALDNYPADRFNYRPAANSVVTVAASGSLSGANWWSTQPSWGATYFPWNDGERTLAPTPWKGALNPNGTTLPVGVLNP